jgi:hypothetical protein
MQGNQSGYILLWVLALMLLAIGSQGLLGVVVAVVFCPTYVTITS